MVGEGDELRMLMNCAGKLFNISSICLQGTEGWQCKCSHVNFIHKSVQHTSVYAQYMYMYIVYVLLKTQMHIHSTSTCVFLYGYACVFVKE